MINYIKKKSLWVSLIAGFLLMVLGLFLLYLLLGPITRHGKNKSVPSVVGKPYEEAVSILEDHDFYDEIQDSVYIDTLPPGAVIRQIPEGDAVVKISRTVYLTINRHVPPMVEMPNLEGYSIRNAEMQLKNMGLRIQDTTYVPDFARNAVRQQLYKGKPIAPGTKIQQGSGITLVLGDGVGKMEFAVPNLIGRTYCEARAMLYQHGVEFGSIMIDPDVVDTCSSFIYWQNPTRFDYDRKIQKIRPGQLMDIRVGLMRPSLDSIPLPENNIPQ